MTANKMDMHRTWLLIIIIFFYSFRSDSANDSAKKWRILFVGNSLTYVNDLPSMIATIAKQDSTTISYTSLAFPDYSLEDHWNEGKLQAEIEKGNYDFVIAQQGPSALPESQVLLLESATKLAELCKNYKTKLVLYMVWPSKARSFDLDNVISSYTNAAEKTSSLLCPAGLAWKYAWEADPTLPLYSFDNFHPSVTGSLLAAITIYASLANKNDVEFISYANCPVKDELTKAGFTILKQAATKAIHH